MSRKLLAVAIPFAACLAWGAALAQPMEELVVEASPITKEGKADTASPAPGYYKVMMSSRVSYTDLDLSKPADFATLESRVNEAAKVVCEKLGKAYPDSGPATKECAKRAADKALTEARKIAGAPK
jgi:UrcA family protein